MKTLNTTFFRVAIALAVPVTSLALTEPRASAQDDFAKREAQARYKEGLSLHDAGKDREARAKFLQAYAVLKHPDVLFNLARSEELAGMTLEALSHYREHARMSDRRITDADRATVQGRIGELSLQTARIEVSAPAGARITVDGSQIVDAAPLHDPVDVFAGKHVVVAMIGGSGQAIEVTVQKGGTARADFNSGAARPVGPVASGAGPASTSPATSASAANAAPRHGTPADSSSRSSATSGSIWPPPLLTWILGGVAVAGGGASVYFALDSKSKADDAAAIRRDNPGPFCDNRDSALCKSLQDKNDQSSTSGTIATVSLVVGGISAAGAIAAWVLAANEAKGGSKASSPRGITIGGSAGKQGAFAIVSGSL